ncbi:MAG: hypothetical protein JWO38_5055 [Gemmataceae bacterium]|nr:hypothetical protein [Gemmataceae bacterium]
MLPGKNGRRNSGRRRTAKAPIGSRNLAPREPIILPDQSGDEDDGEDFYECENPRPTRAVLLDDDDDADDLSEPVARFRARREPARQAEAEARAKAEAEERAEAKSVPPVVGEDVGDDGGEGEEGETAAQDDTPDFPPLTAEEVRWREKRDRVIWKKLGQKGRDRLRTIDDPAKLTSQPGYLVVCHGVGLRLLVQQALDAYARLYHSPLIGEREERQARYKEILAERDRAQQAVDRYDAWVAAHRPELADDWFVEMLARSTDDRVAAEARLAECDGKYKTAPPAKSKGEKDEIEFPLPVLYQKEYQGKVRAYPEWIAPVLRAVAGKRGHNIPAMALVLAQLVYWMRPKDATGRPRARRAKLINEKWWVVLGYGAIEKQTPVSKGQARQAVRHLKELNLVETLTSKKAKVGSEAGGVDFGPNTVFLRVNTEVLDPLVKAVMSG